MKLRMLIYNYLVNRHPVIQKNYYRLRAEKHGTAGRLYAWVSLLWMNIRWALGSRNIYDKDLNPDEKKRIESGFVESAGSQELSCRELAEKLLTYDVISFDIFDTLLFRPFMAPTDLFFAVGQRLNYMDFENIRRAMEWRAREKKYAQCASYEVTLAEIYAEMEAQAGVPAEEGMAVELDTELSYCFGNPYMLEVFRILARENQHSKIICTSDMYLPSAFLRKLLNQAGFESVEQIFVSCEEGASKSDGRLYEKLKASFPGAKIIHVGDNLCSDNKQAKTAGLDAHLYHSVNQAGMPYRAMDLSLITGSMYRGIVNSRIHNGSEQYSADYELGYIYGGFFVLAYCQFIHSRAVEQKWDKLLFLSRDGDVIKKVYDMLYTDIPTEYVYWSRTAATKLGAKYYKYDYLRRFIDHKVNQNVSLRKLMDSAELQDMLPEMTKAYLELGADTVLTGKNSGLVRKFFLANWDAILEHYAGELKAGGKYYEKVLSGCRNVAAVDVGWAGSGAIVLRQLAQKEWKLDCNITGVVAGTNSYNNAEQNASEQFLYSGEMVSFLYSQELNRDMWKWHNPGQNHNLIVEMLLTSEEGSFKGFTPDETFDDGYRLVFKKPDVDVSRVREIQKGIMDFVCDYQRLVPTKVRQMHSISGGDAYAVLKLLLQSKIDTELEMGI